MQETKEPIKNILTKQSKYEQPGEKETNGTRQYIKGNNPKEID